MMQGWRSFFWSFEKSMAEIKKKGKQPAKTERPQKSGQHTSHDHASGVPGGGGSRQGNIGHESNERSDNSHR